MTVTPENLLKKSWVDITEEEVVDCLNQSTKEQIDYANEYGESLCFLSASSGFSNALKIIIDKGCRIDAFDKSGRVPLTRAIFNKNTWCAEELIKAGANLNTINNEGKTPLSLTSIKGMCDLSIKLVRAGAEVNPKKSPVKWSPLHYATSDEDYGLISALIEHGADLTCIGGVEKLTPLDIAKSTRNKGVITLLELHLEKAMKNSSDERVDTVSSVFGR